jgi:multidrug efflux system outer membrane protein
MRTRTIAVALPCLAVVCLALTGCTVGPHYKRPAIDVPTVYRGAGDTPDTTQAASLADQKWWDLFQDQQLQQ